ncbi:MAG: S41 family peptidase [Candidatus Sumerlaeales bacterium]|nr:S41 family peptidase [Candidatus Sumerlaeales bacterium]
MFLTPKGFSPKKIVLVCTLFIVFSSMLVVGLYAQNARKADDERMWEFAALFAEIYKNIDERYVEDVDKKKLLEGALQGMFLTLDQHSQYMTPDSLSQLEKDTEGNFSGIGIHIQMKDGVLTCVAPMPGSPAAKAGMKPWDRIIEIDGKKTELISLTDAVKKLTGPAGTTVKLTVYREGEPEWLHFELVRGNIKVDSVYSHMLTDDIGYLRISKFSDSTSQDLAKAIDDCRQKGAKGFILDLRFNTGGLLQEAISVSNLFLPKGKIIVSTKGRIASQNQKYFAQNDPVTDLPLIVLINRGSASASEIVTGALKDYNRACIVGIKGQRTFGKGSVQSIQPLNNSFEKDENGNTRQAGLRLTTAHYFTPSEVKIDKIGITPDIAVELPKDNETDLLKLGMYGDPGQNETEMTTASQFQWKNYNGKDDGKSTESTTTSATSETNDLQTTSADEATNPNTNKDGDDEDMPSLIPSALKKSDDAKTTAAEPKRIIPLDRELFPKAEVEKDPKMGITAALTSPTVERSKFVDYQLKVAERLMENKLKNNVDFLDKSSAMPAKFDEITSGTKETSATKTN